MLNADAPARFTAIATRVEGVRAYIQLRLNGIIYEFTELRAQIYGPTKTTDRAPKSTEQYQIEMEKVSTAFF